MTVQSVIQEACAFLGVRPPPGTVFLTPDLDRTSWEFVNLANEMAQRISRDERDWQVLRVRQAFIGTGTPNSATVDPNAVPHTVIPLPTNYQRMLLTGNLWTSRQPLLPLNFISDPDQWISNELTGYINPNGEWSIYGNNIHIRPTVGNGEKIQFMYLRNTCVNLYNNGVPGLVSTVFTNDMDTFVLPERLLKLGIIWQWKAYKGATYAEDLANYEDALARVAGSDKPGAIMVGNKPVSSAATIAYWGPVPPPGTFVGPGL